MLLGGRKTRTTFVVAPRRSLCALHTVAIVVLVMSTSGRAQSPSAVVYGVVQGADVPLADVTIRLLPAGQSQPAAHWVTGADGRFRFAGLIWGRYRLEFAAAGWQSRTVNIDLRSDGTLWLNTTLVPLAAEKSPRSQLLDESVWHGTQFGDLQIRQLPNGRNIWSLLEAQEPSTVTNRFDIAGLQTATPALFSAFGASWTENQYQFNGLDVTDPYTPGLPLINPGIDTLSEFRVVTASKPAASQGSGENLALASPEPGGALHGGIAFYGSGGALQSNNMDARLRMLGFPGPERLNSLIDAQAQLGGALPKATGTIPFFLSLSTQQAAQNLGGFAAPVDSGVNRVLADLAPWSHGSQRLNVLYSGQHVFNSAQGAMPTIAPSATTRGNDNFNQFQALWSQHLCPAAVLTASFGVVNAIESSAFQNQAQGASAVNLPSLTLTGPAPLATSGIRTRYEANGTLRTIAYGPWGTHSLSLGLDWERSEVVNRWYSMGDSLEVLVDGAGSEVIRWNTPARAKQHVQNVAEYVQDSWRPWKWLALPVGVRIDTSSGQANRVANSINWTTVQPRAGFVVPLRPAGLVLQGSWSRYGHLLQGSYLDFGNPAALGAQVYRWEDGNGDGIAQPSGLGPLLRVWGGPYSAVDPHIARPYTDEFNFGLQENFSNRLMASLRFLRRDDHRLIALDNIGVPFSQYTLVQYPDPGNDGIYGTSDDQVLTLYNENPSALGHDFLLLTNPSGLRASYKGVEAVVSVRPQQAWGFSASFTAGQTLARTSPGNSPLQNDTGVVSTLAIDPNTLVMSQGRTYFDRGYTGKVTAYYFAPHGFYLAAVATYLDGVSFGRLLFVNGFNQGPFFVRATPVGHPGGFQTELNSSLDFRFARDFRARRGVVSGYFDVFNLLNLNNNTQEMALTGPTFLERVPVSIEAPRTFRLGISWVF